MPRQSIPERQSISDSFTGTLIEVNGNYAITDAESADATIIVRDTMTIRYGVQYLAKPHLAIVPGLLALDYGDILTGESAWEFLLNRSNLYPRAEVFGYRNDGRDDMIVVKLLDLAAPIKVFAYADNHATTPIAQVNACIAHDDRPLRSRIMKYVPHYPTIKAWLQQDTNNA